MDKTISLVKRLLMVAVVVGAVFCTAVAPAQALTDEQKFVAEVWRLVDRAYVDDSFNHQNWWLTRQKALKQAMIDREAAYEVVQKMLASLDDPFTRLLKPDQYKSLQTNTSGELTGVGLQIASDPDTGELKVIAPIAGSPAERAGIRPADTIVQIDHAWTSHLSLDEAADRMRGPIGSRVVLTVKREQQDPQEIEMVRDRIALNPVVADLRVEKGDDGQAKKVGYIRLTQFNANATTEVMNSIKTMEAQGADAYVLDLRSNPGGLLQAGIEIARLWLDQGTIVYTVNRQGIEGNFEATGNALTQDPLVVLVNQGTASASEILAGALKDNGRATIVGERTFGKGLIQSLFDLSDGSGLAVTVAKYETPAHIDINRQGIQPDITVPLDPIALKQVATATDLQYQTAIEVLTRQAMVAGAS